MFSFARLSLIHQFMLMSLFILLIGMLVIGFVIGGQIEHGVINQLSAVTALYVDSFISSHLRELEHRDALSNESIRELQTLLSETPLGLKIVSFKIWSPQGRVLYSLNQELIGKTYEISDGLRNALIGQVSSEISSLREEENVYELLNWSQLIETYAPVWSADGREIIAVSEFYQLPDELLAEIRKAQLYSWSVVGGATVVMYLLMNGFMKRASDTILRQRQELSDQLETVHTLLQDNKKLHYRVSRAAARTTALNEKFLRRISADLHDGPVQDLSLALLRIEPLGQTCLACQKSVSQGRAVGEDLATIRMSLESCLREIRVISAGLRLPDLEGYTLEEVIRRLLVDFHRKTHKEAGFSLKKLPKRVPNPIKIALYRVLQEALSNSYRHAGNADIFIAVGEENQILQLSISDNGTGFDVSSPADQNSLGIIGMRERVELLGGTFEVRSQLKQGTKIEVTFPLDNVVAGWES